VVTTPTRGIGFVAALSAVLLSALSGTARAEEFVTATAEQRKAAEARYEQGVDAFRGQRYADAVRLFLDADRMAPSGALSFNIARAYEEMGDDSAALRWYRNYLRVAQDAPNGVQVGARVQALSRALSTKGIQQITVLSAPEGATVAIDGHALGVTPLTVELPPGAHVAWLTARGYDDARREFQLAPTTPLDLTFQLIAGSSESSPMSSPTRPESNSHRRFGPVPWITIGVGAAALVSALGFELARQSAENDARHDQEQLAFEHHVDAMTARQTASRVFLGVGAVLGATGGALLVLNTRVNANTLAAVSSVPGGATVTLSRNF